jgi:hypothetical protein
MQPYQRPNAPLTGGARFIRGFARIGAVAAVLVMLTGLAITFFQATSSYNYETTGAKSAKCIADQVRAGFTFKKKYDFSDNLNYEAFGCSDSGIYGKPLTEVMAIANAPTPTFLTSGAPTNLGIGLIITGVCAVVTYLFFWCIGWLCAGFTKDARTPVHFLRCLLPSP